MNDASAVAATSTNWIQNASNNPIDFLKTLDDLLESFGAEEIGNAASQQYLGKFIEGIRSQINDSDLPQGVKDSANAILDSFSVGLSEACPCSSEASEAVAESSESADIDQSAEADAEAAGEAANEGTAPADEGAGAGGAGGAGGPDSMDELNEEQANSPNKDKNRGGNWLEALAGDLAGIQSKFLEKAMAAKDIMMAEADIAGAGEGKSSAFLDAQAQYTATMQLFTIFSNQTSTSIKSIGEALAGISRKQ